MWIGDNEGWLSIVKHLDKDDHLLVRARRKEHIKNIFPDANIYENMKADYPYRADIPKSDVISTMVERVDRIDYPKPSILDTILGLFGQGSSGGKSRAQGIMQGIGGGITDFANSPIGQLLLYNYLKDKKT